jgi:hypothetical protein
VDYAGSGGHDPANRVSRLEREAGCYGVGDAGTVVPDDRAPGCGLLPPICAALDFCGASRFALVRHSRACRMGGIEQVECACPAFATKRNRKHVARGASSL